MILIISEDLEQSTSNVIEWLIFYNEPFIRIHPEEKIAIKKIEIANENYQIILTIDKKDIDLDKIKAYWYRRGNLNIKVEEDKFSDFFENADIENSIKAHLSSEIHTARNFLHYFLMEKKGLGNIFSAHNNKLYTLRQAAKVGLKIPKTAVFTNKTNLKKWSFRKQIITKGIDSVAKINIDGHYAGNYTEVVSKQEIENHSDQFLPSLFQEEIKKEYEIRSFFIEDDFYSMAIFSQSDPKTQTDFRKYNYQKPNRTIPIELPEYIKNRLRKLTRGLKLNTGSIDLIYSTDGTYYFLEVNPIGQYGMVSEPCNFNLDKVIANYLRNENS